MKELKKFLLISIALLFLAINAHACIGNPYGFEFTLPEGKIDLLPLQSECSSNCLIEEETVAYKNPEGFAVELSETSFGMQILLDAKGEPIVSEVDWKQVSLKEMERLVNVRVLNLNTGEIQKISDAVGPGFIGGLVGGEADSTFGVDQSNTASEIVTYKARGMGCGSEPFSLEDLPLNSLVFSTSSLLEGTKQDEGLMSTAAVGIVILGLVVSLLLFSKSSGK